MATLRHTVQYTHMYSLNHRVSSPASFDRFLVTVISLYRADSFVLPSDKRPYNMVRSYGTQFKTEKKKLLNANLISLQNDIIFVTLHSTLLVSLHINVQGDSMVLYRKYLFLEIDYWLLARNPLFDSNKSIKKLWMLYWNSLNTHTIAGLCV